jgi:hypothetical protein
MSSKPIKPDGASLLSMGSHRRVTSINQGGPPISAPRQKSVKSRGKYKSATALSCLQTDSRKRPSLGRRS